MQQLTKGVPLLLITLSTSCVQNDRTIDISDVELEVAWERLDQALFSTPPDRMSASMPLLQQQFGGFFRLYVEQILMAGPVNDPRTAIALIGFTQDPDWKSAQRSIDAQLGDMAEQQAQLTNAFKRLQVLFPNKRAPRIVVYNSGFNYGILPTDSVLGIGAEWFIGPQEPVISYLAPETFPQYQKDRMVPGMMVPSALKGWLLAHYSRPMDGQDLLSHLVETGKVMALLDALLPDVDPTLKLAFTNAQLLWCEQNEFNIWKEIIDKEMLFSKKEPDIGRMMNDGPFTNGFPRESPGHIGEWVGLQMVSSFMEDDPGITFAELFSIQDPQRILKSYRPR